MKKLNLLMSALAVLALASCSNDEVVNNASEKVAQQSIGFSPLTKRASTRANIVNKAADLKDFAVTAYAAQPLSGLFYIAGEAKTLALSTGDVYTYDGVDMSNIKIVYRDGGWDYNNASDTKYWPYTKTGETYSSSGYQLDFVAISPAAAVGNGFAFSNEGGTITNYTVGADDLCHATATAEQSGGQVQLNFKHLLSQIKFAAKKATGMTVDIKEITLANVPNLGSLSPISGTPAWTVAASTTKADYQGNTGVFSVQAAGDAAPADTITTSGYEILVLPQDASLVTYDPTTISASNPVSGTGKLYLKVSCRVKVAGSTTWAIGGDEGNYKDIYFSLSTTWKPGTKYTYTLLFGGVKDPDATNPPGEEPGGETGGGTDDEGKTTPPTTPITFSASVTDWVDATKDIAF